MNKEKDTIKCIRCGSNDIINQKKVYICLNCRLEFEKEVLVSIQTDLIDSNIEKGFLYRALFYNKSKNVKIEEDFA
ncbi:hypothetical protein LCGC14_1138280 [marine sediment metagenome]|uniref:Uncharacterized protein n=1 Tax=marine sediment metagenome TaxID=412755 RepID=A0A0F9PH87_9ZZZZ